MIGCKVQKEYIPIENKTYIEYRDSIIQLKDTIYINLPIEKVVNVIPKIDTSILSTKLAVSTAYLDTNSMVIHHTLENRSEPLKKALDTIIIFQTKTEYTEKPVIVEKEKEVKYVPKIYKYAMWFSLTIILMICLKIFSKLKGGFF